MEKIRFCIVRIVLLMLSFGSVKMAASQPAEKPMVIAAYYVGNGSDLGSYNTGELTHIIFSFLHLKGNKLNVDKPEDSLAITRLVALKDKNPGLKVILSLGGWGGCKTCSEVFASESGRMEFAWSALQLLKEFHADGLDLDWEYPALESVRGHQFLPDDRQNFTYLIKTLRKTLGEDYELSFAAGGFTTYLQQSVEWNQVMPLVNYVNLMTYDFVNGNSTVTGHLTPLYPTTGQKESTDHTVMFLDSAGVPMNKVVIGMAFYGRTFTKVDAKNHGLFQQGKFSEFVNFKDIDSKLGKDTGFNQYWDKFAKAPYAYNEKTKTFATYDNIQSVYFKTKYAREHNLAGVMFWELSGDKPSGGLLDMIFEAAKK